MAPTVWRGIPAAPEDAFFALAARYRADSDPKKVDLGIGAYRDADGRPFVLPSIKAAKERLSQDPTFNHEYGTLSGWAPFLSGSAEIVWGKDDPVVKEERVAALQTVSGSGALHQAGLFLREFYGPWSQGGEQVIYTPDPTWSAHHEIFGTVGVLTRPYTYYDPRTCLINIQGMVSAVEQAPSRSVFLLQVCGHNPTGVDPTRDDWAAIASAMASRNHLALFDAAYMGLTSGRTEEDAYPIRLFQAKGIDVLLCLSWSKIAGIYAERAGCLMAVGEDADEAAKMAGQMALLQMKEISVAPGYGAKVVSTMMKHPDLLEQWKRDVEGMAERIKGVRKELRSLLENKYKTPGTWKHIDHQQGMFSYLGLTYEQCEALRQEHHVYVIDDGRASMAGLNGGNIDYVAASIDAVVRKFNTGPGLP